MASYAAPARTIGRLKRPFGNLYYEVSGSGPALLFAHGLGGNHLSWWQQVAHFAPRRGSILGCTVAAPGAKFCGSCGAALAAAPLHCSACGAEAPAGAKFCAACGTKL